MARSARIAIQDVKLRSGENPGRATYLARKIVASALWALGTLLFSSVLVFSATQLMAGNVAQMILGTFATPEATAALEARLGLDRPAIVQYTSWLGRILTGDFGESLRLSLPIAPILLKNLELSLILATASLGLVCVIGIAAGVVAALWNRGPIDRALSAISLLGISMPEFVTGSLLVLLLSSVLPVSGYVTFEEGLGSWLAHLILPVTTLTFIMLAHVMRTARISMIDALSAPYTRTAMLKGLPTSTVVIKHALRNALLPTITVLGINVGYLVGGIVVVEMVFSYPGLGRLTVFALQNRDVPLIQACTLTMAAIYILASFVTEILYLVINPRLRDS
jgi:peptide/nickel transport system permease protein